MWKPWALWSAWGNNPSEGVGSQEGLVLDFANNTYQRNGVVYATFAEVLAAGGGSFSRASAGYDLLGSASFATDTPRITAAGLLLESAATNLITQSKMASGWSADNATITANNQTAPDGTTTAQKVVEDGATATHGNYVNQAATALSAVRYVRSVYAKRQAGTRNLFLQLYDQSFAKLVQAGFDLSNGSVNVAISNAASAWTAGVASSYAAAQSFYRTYFSVVPDAVTGIWAIQRMLSGTANSYAGDSTSAISVWGAQLELAAADGYFKDNPSSLIVTGAAAATRAADVLSLNVPTGKAQATITFSDNTTKVQAVTGGASWNAAATVATHVATNVVAPVLKSITFA